MISIYDFDNYQSYLNEWIKNNNVSTGLKSKLASAANISTTLVSLVLNGKKDFSKEQALEISLFLNLNSKETDYFLLLVDFARAGTEALKKRIKNKISESQLQAQNISHRVIHDTVLTDEIKAVYYSSWIYSAIRNLSALEQYNEPNTISQRLKTDVSQIIQALDFLLDHGICIKENGKIHYGNAHTFIGKDSPLVFKHHQNWRIRGFEKMEYRRHKDIFFTCPMSLSNEAIEEIKKLLYSAIETITKIAAPSPSEDVICVNIDLFEI